MPITGLLLVLGLKVNRVAHRLDDQLLGLEILDVHEDLVVVVVVLDLSR